MDLALNNLQRLICHKTQTTNQPHLHKNELGHNATKATKTIFCRKGKGAVDYSTVTRYW